MSAFGDCHREHRAPCEDTETQCIGFRHPYFHLSSLYIALYSATSVTSVTSVAFNQRRPAGPARTWLDAVGATWYFDVMARLEFTPNLQRHVTCPASQVTGSTVREVLNEFFAENTRARGYVLDDQGALRKHMVIFVNGTCIRDRTGLSDRVPPDGEVYVMQSLSGG